MEKKVKDKKNIKSQITMQYKNGKSANEIIKEYNIPKSTFYYWVKMYVPKKKEITYSEYYKVIKKLKLKTLEFKIFQDLHCFKDAPTKEKEIAISKFVGIYPIKTMCRLLDIPNGTFYNYHFRRKEITQNQIRDEQLKLDIYNISILLKK